MAQFRNKTREIKVRVTEEKYQAFQKYVEANEMQYCKTRILEDFIDVCIKELSK